MKPRGWEAAKKRRSASDNTGPAQPKMTALMTGFSELDKEADRPEAKDAENTASNYPRDGERASELVLG